MTKVIPTAISSLLLHTIRAHCDQMLFLSLFTGSLFSRVHAVRPSDFDAKELVAKNHDCPPGTYRSYVINRQKDVDRYSKFASRAGKANLIVERFDAIDKDELAMTRYLDSFVENGLVRAELVEGLKNKTAGFACTEDIFVPGQNCLGTLACSLSHIMLWQKLAAESNDRVSVIFEDDADIPENFSTELQRAMCAVPQDWDMIMLGHSPRVVGDAVNSLFVKPALSSPIGTNGQHHAYVVRPSGLKKVLQFMSPVSSYATSDNTLRKNFDKYNAYFLKDSMVKQAHDEASVRKIRSHY